MKYEPSQSSPFNPRSAKRVFQPRQKWISKSCSIPGWLPRWRKVNFKRDEFPDIKVKNIFYARKNIHDDSCITIFDFTNKKSVDVTRKTFDLTFMVERKLTEVENHKVEDYFECSKIKLRGKVCDKIE